MFMWWLFTMMFPSFRLRFSLIVPVSFRSCEVSFDYVRLSSSWTHSSSLWDLGQDDHYPRYHFYLCFASCSFYRYACATYHLFIKPPKLPCQPLTFSPFLANRCLAMLPLLLSPSYSVASCRWRLEAVPCWNIFYLLVGISLYCYVILMHLYTW